MSDLLRKENRPQVIKNRTEGNRGQHNNESSPGGYTKQK